MSPVNLENETSVKINKKYRLHDVRCNVTLPFRECDIPTEFLNCIKINLLATQSIPV
jgi:hypothetical protein